MLWQYAFSNFNEKVRWALDFKGIPHVRRSLAPGSPRAILFSVRGTVPVLDAEGERLVDSTRIIEALERAHPEPALYPSDPEERRRALELEDFFDEEVGHELRRALFYEMRDDREFIAAVLTTDQGRLACRILRTVFSLPGSMAYANRRYRIYADDAGKAKVKLLAALDRIAAEAGPDGYLVGSRFSVADLTAAALLYPLAWPAEFPYDLPDRPDPGSLRPVLEHPACGWISDMYCRHRGTSAEIGGG